MYFGISPLQVVACMRRNASCWSQGRLESWWHTPQTFGWAETSQSLHLRICLLEFSCLQAATYGCRTQRKAGPNLVFWWICWQLSTMQITNLFLSVIKGTLLCNWHVLQCLSTISHQYDHMSALTERYLSRETWWNSYLCIWTGRPPADRWSWGEIKSVGRENRKQVKERKSNREFANQANEPQC